MNNELFNHQKSDAVKWVCTLLAFLIVGVLIAGIICGWFDKKETPPAEQTETGFIVTPDEINGVSLSVKTMSANGNEVNAMAETSYTVTATIQPSTALQKADWSLSWKDGNSSWANGKTVTDYVTLSAEAGAVTATVTLVSILLYLFKEESKMHVKNNPSHEVAYYIYKDKFFVSLFFTL